SLACSLLFLSDSRADLFGLSLFLFVSVSLSLTYTSSLSLSLDYFQTKIWKHGETRLILDCSLGLYDI
ncbi:unnamed protein product, partial [Brassica rapa subsp. trilocularis]